MQTDAHRKPKDAGIQAHVSAQTHSLCTITFDGYVSQWDAGLYSAGSPSHCSESE